MIFPCPTSDVLLMAALRPKATSSALLDFCHRGWVSFRTQQPRNSMNILYIYIHTCTHVYIIHIYIYTYHIYIYIHIIYIYIYVHVNITAHLCIFCLGQKLPWLLTPRHPLDWTTSMLIPFPHSFPWLLWSSLGISGYFMVCSSSV